MAGNSFGRLFTVTSFGESHGAAIGCVMDGCPPGMALNAADIQQKLGRGKPGTSRHVTQRREPDIVEILSGVFEGCATTGAPIAKAMLALMGHARCHRAQCGGVMPPLPRLAWVAGQS
jgi:chorismate synthase